jgi:hypothetical protein
VIASAVVVDWDAVRYSKKLPKVASVTAKRSMTAQKKEESLRKRYPPLGEVKVSRPCIITDAHGVILAWYLPGILIDSRQAGIFTLSNRGSKFDAYQSEILAATEKLGPTLRKIESTRVSNPSTSKSSGGNWRNDPKNFQPGTAPEAAINISPAWFQQAHEVSVSACRPFYRSAAHFNWPN